MTRQNTYWLPRLLLLWACYAAVTFMVMLLHTSDHPVAFGRYSALVLAQLASLLAVVMITGGVGLYLRRRSVLLERIDQRLGSWRAWRWLTPFVVIVAAVFLVLVWLFFLGDHVATYAFLRAFVVSTLVVGALALLYGGCPVVTVSWRTVPLMIVVALCLLIIIILPVFPNLAKTDEAFVFSMARNALETGSTRPAIYRQAFPENYYGGVWITMMSTWLRFAGISLVSGRAYVWFLSIVSILFLYLGAKRLYDRVTAWFVVLIGLYAFASLNHIRFDIHTAFWLSLGIFCYSMAHTSGRWWFHLATGFAVGMCVDSNPAGYCFGLGLGAAYAWEYLRAIRTRKQWIYAPFWLIALGGAAAVLLYLRLHAGGSFAGNRETSDLLGLYGSFISGSLASGHAIGQLQQYLFIFITAQPILFMLVVLGLITAFRRNQPVDRLLLIMHGVWVLVIVFAYFYFPIFYLMLALPLFVLLAARGVADGIPTLIGSISNGATALTRTATIFLSVLFVAAIGNALLNPSDSLADVVEAGHQIGQIVPQDATIVAAEPYYFGMLDHRQFVGGAVESIVMNNKGLKQEEVWPQIKPDAVVFSEHWPQEPQRNEALLAYLQDQQFGLRACYQTPSFGRVELWTRDATSGADVTCTVITRGS